MISPGLAFYAGVVLADLVAIGAFVGRRRLGWMAALLASLPFLIAGPALGVSGLLRHASQFRAAWFADSTMMGGVFSLPVCLLAALLARLLARITIGRLMALIGLLAIALGAVASPFDRVTVTLLAVSVTSFFLFAFYIAVVVVPYSIILRRMCCPACGKRALRCVTIQLFNPPLASFHNCRSCGAILARRLGRPWEIIPGWLDGPGSSNGPGSTSRE